MKTNVKDIPPTEVRAAHTMFDITEFLRENDGATITEASNSLGYAKSTVLRHLTTLKALGYVVEEPDGYHLGLRFLTLGHHARHRRKGYELAKEKVEELAEKTGERAQFIVEETGQAVYLHRALGEQAVRTDPGIGHRISLHATAAGKAILATMPEDQRFEIIEHLDFEALTSNTIMNRDELLTKLERVRERGYSFNKQENLEGLRAVGVAVRGPEKGAIGALSISGPTHRMQNERFEEELPNLLLGTANELELNIQHS